METKRVIVVGAGFSAPAKLPIQNQIINKMSQSIKDDESITFLSDFHLGDSKFLHAYISVGLFLLKNYGKHDYSLFAENYREIQSHRDATESLLKSINIANNTKLGEAYLVVNYKELFEEGSLIQFNDYYSKIYKLKECIRSALNEEKISTNLEDIFTLFDKSMGCKDYYRDYSYAQMDEIRRSITKLFVYYFTRGVADYACDNNDYASFFRFIKQSRTKYPATIITTNWDTIIEKHCNRYKIPYDYCFYEKYTTHNIAKTIDRKLSLIKIHGSINWLRCYNCGTITVRQENVAANALLYDESNIICDVCERMSNGDLSGCSNLEPEIVTPTMLKTINDQVYANLWGTAGRELRSATHVIIIGYSLPVADYEFRYLLQKNISPSTRIDVVLAEDCDPSKKEKSAYDYLPQSRYLNAFPKNDIHFYYKGFADYFEKKTYSKRFDIAEQ